MKLKKGISDAGMNRIAQMAAPDYGREDTIDRVNVALQELQEVYTEGLSEEGMETVERARADLQNFVSNMDRMFK